MSELSNTSTGFYDYLEELYSNFMLLTKTLAFPTDHPDYKAAMRDIKRKEVNQDVFDCQENEKGKRSPSGKRHKYLQKYTYGQQYCLLTNMCVLL
jgi:hypothetical protein